MVNFNPLFDALDERDSRKPSRDLEGVVRAVRGNTVSVSTGGSRSLIRALNTAGFPLEPGDRVLLSRTGRSQQWSVSQQFTSGTAGHRDSSPAKDAFAARVNNLSKPIGGLVVPPFMNVSRDIPEVSGVEQDDVTIGMEDQTANTFLAAPDRSRGQPEFRALTIDDMPAGINPSPNFSLVDAGKVWAGPPGAPGPANFRKVEETDLSFTPLTSISLNVPSHMNVSNSPLTANGSITIGMDSQYRNRFLAASSTSTWSTPSFRDITTNDLPSGINPVYGYGAFLSGFGFRYDSGSVSYFPADGNVDHGGVRLNSYNSRAVSGAYLSAGTYTVLMSYYRFSSGGYVRLYSGSINQSSYTGTSTIMSVNTSGSTGNGTQTTSWTIYSSGWYPFFLRNYINNGRNVFVCYVAIYQ